MPIDENHRVSTTTREFYVKRLPDEIPTPCLYSSSIPRFSQVPANLFSDCKRINLVVVIAHLHSVRGATDATIFALAESVDEQRDAMEGSVSRKSISYSPGGMCSRAAPYHPMRNPHRLCQDRKVIHVHQRFLNLEDG